MTLSSPSPAANRKQRRRAAKAKAQPDQVRRPLDTTEALNQAVQLHRQGRLADAEALYRSVLDGEPHNKDALNLLGLIALQTEHFDDAIILFTKAISADAGVADFYVNLAQCHRAKGQFDLAASQLQQALHINPNSVAALNNLANLHMRLQRREKARPLFERALSIDDRKPEVLSSYAGCLIELGELDLAKVALGRCLDLRPDLPDAQINKAVLAYKTGDLAGAMALVGEVLVGNPKNGRAWLVAGQIEASGDDHRAAIESFWRACELDPKDSEALANLANCCRAVGHLDRAEGYAQNAVRLAPDSPYAKLVLGKIYTDQGRPEDAERVLKEAIAQDRGLAEAYINLALSIRKTGADIGQAIDYLTKAIEIDPTLWAAHNNLGINLMDCCDFDRAIRVYENGREHCPDSHILASSHLMALHYLPDYSAEQIHDVHLEWGERYAGPVSSSGSFDAWDLDPDRPLRLGFVSSSFRRHPVGYMTLGCFQAIDRDRFGIHIYSGVGEEDDFTALYRDLASSWTDTRGLSDEALAQRIREDRIDILVDLSGHAAGNRLLSMARRPSPINVKWVGGLFNTTGVREVDYLISDANETPEGVDHLYTEKLIRMPNGYVSYMPPDYAPDVGELPMARNGHVTFGCYNNISKISIPIAAVWARIMERCKGSRLILVSRWLNQDIAKRALEGILTSAGIDLDRVELRTGRPHRDLLDSYNEIDIALDPWPYSGGLTTCEALWMGVPVVTLPGPTFAGRHSVSHLKNIGLDQWVASSEDEYVAIACGLEKNVNTLQAIRDGLRNKVGKSPLCDHGRFARHLEQHLRDIWARWTRERKGTY